MNNISAYSSTRRVPHMHRSVRALNGKRNGFSLIELIIAVAIVGLLASAALPSYSSFTMKQRRVEAHHLSQINANRLSRCHVFSGTYDSDCKLLETSENGYYELANKSVWSDGWILVIVPTSTGPQDADNECNFFISRSNGKNTALGASAEFSWGQVDGCW